MYRITIPTCRLSQKREDPHIQWKLVFLISTPLPGILKFYKKSYMCENFT